MNYGILLKKTSTVYGWAYHQNGLRNLNVDYLDESTKRDYNQQTTKSIDYLTKEEIGKVHVGGFLHKKLVQARQADEPSPVNLPNEVRKERIATSWRNHLENFGAPRRRGSKDKSKPPEIIGHKIVISFSTEMTGKLRCAGISPEAALQDTLKKTMRAYQEEFCKPGDSIGYAYGIHHDTDNLHAHVLLMPTTEKGETIGFSSQLKNKKHRETRRKDYIGFVKRHLAYRQRQWEQTVSDPVKLRNFISKERNARLTTGVQPRSQTVPNPSILERHKVAQDRQRIKLAREKFLKARANLRLLRATRSNRLAFRNMVSINRSFLLRPSLNLVSSLNQMANQVSVALVRLQYRQTRSDYFATIQKLKNQQPRNHSAYEHPIWRKFHLARKVVTSTSEQTQRQQPSTHRHL